ncbi:MULTISPECIES: OmpP1/FadL family transporter [Vitreoscilla]|uniref:Outer membrane protein transport protein n=1 Tax=Vitreoscilla stercoraria TaxID=61 RepID=A0ABY4E9N7_VITST|nr:MULTISPECIES: OmpP1/FadL family transporter [Vitreoscilla]AUZ03965.1 outer membrane protein [Vitreoscilla sp. C1]UOO92114.1 outer membrane protein transport protein [Vitreoscilla stercoraria]
MKQHFLTTVKISSVLILAGLTAQAHASGYHFGTQSVSAQSTANSSAAEAADPSTIFYNPAGLTKLPGTQATINLNVVFPSIKVDDAKGYYPTNPDGSPTDGTVGKGERISGFNSDKIDPGPTFAPHFYASHQVNDRVSVGIGGFVPFGSGTEYEHNSVLRYNLNELGLQTIAIQPTVAFKLNDNHSFGIGLVAQHTTAELRQYANFGPALRAGLAESSTQAAAGLMQLNAGIAQLNGGIAQYDTGIAQAEAGITQLQAALQANPNSAQLQAQLEGTQQARDKAVAERTALQTQLAGVTKQQQTVTAQKQAVDGQLANMSASGNGDADGYAKVKGDDWGFGYNLAWMWDINESVRVGVNYRSKVEHDLKGDAEWILVGQSFQNPNLGSTLSQQIRDRGYKAKEDASVKIVTPESLSLHGMWKANPKWNVFADATWTRHSRFNQAILQFGNLKTVTTAQTGDEDAATAGSQSSKTRLYPNWKDTWKVGVGASYQYSEPLQLRFGMAYDQSPVRDSSFRMSTLPDNDRIWFSLGAKYDINKQNTVNFAYSYIHIKNSDAIVNGYGTGDRNAYAQANVSSKTDGTAKFKSNGQILGVQYTYRF